MMQILYILVAILLFGMLVAVHEWGHFAVAKLCGVRVNEFSIGMGPSIWQREKGETVYSLRALPVGGFCLLEGEDGFEGDARSFGNQGFFKQVAILMAGSFMNLLTGFLLVLLVYADAGGFYSPTITDFAPEFDTATIALEPGDTLYKIDGERVYLYTDISLLLSLGDGISFDLEVVRQGQRVVLDDVPLVRQEYTDSQGNLYTGYGLLFGEIEEATVFNKLKNSWYTTLGFARTVRLSLEMLASGEAGIEDVSGPVGIVDTISQVGAASPSLLIAMENIIYFGAMLAVNLAVMNMLPIPALDGGRILFLVVDVVAMKVLGKRLPERYMSAINTVFFLLLMGVILLITFKDIFVLFQ